MEKYKVCTKCQRNLPLGQFYKVAKNKDGLMYSCKECWKTVRHRSYQKNKRKVAIYGAKYRAANSELVKQRTKLWRQKNKAKWLETMHNRRARLLSASKHKVTHKELARLLAKPCLYCDKPSDTIDHIVPLSRGGLHSIGNLVGACSKCNKSKNNKFITEWKMSELRA